MMQPLTSFHWDPLPPPPPPPPYILFTHLLPFTNLSAIPSCRGRRRYALQLLCTLPLASLAQEACSCIKWTSEHPVVIQCIICVLYCFQLNNVSCCTCRWTSISASARQRTVLRGGLGAVCSVPTPAPMPWTGPTALRQFQTTRWRSVHSMAGRLTRA